MTDMKKQNGAVLLTGGAGYIGTHTTVALLEAGFDVIVADNFSNSCPEAINRVEQITGKKIKLYEVDVADQKQLVQIFAENKITGVIHFAGFKAVGESVKLPIKYYRNNLDTTLTLLECMARFGVKNLVFSSSATVYGDENPSPCVETMRTGKCANPYGMTKAFIEQILVDVAAAHKEMSIVLLRYFNPVGAHPSGLIGENPGGIPNNLMPYVSQVAVGKRDKLTIFGNDYNTPDGTCQRDFIHIMDLAQAHVKAIEFVEKNCGLDVFNIGTGEPYSVLDLVQTFEKVNGLKIPYEFGARREGDLPVVWADVSKAARVLGWKAELNLEDMCRDSWNWQKKNPHGINSSRN
ncbi:MAG: UDP-glucose 4-epimerase GalE [Phascolarctobacterium sp.]|nr:UDP-glucose 4-epimerase GalE [Phascolarctobacterium sp.]